MRHKSKAGLVCDQNYRTSYEHKPTPKPKEKGKKPVKDDMMHHPREGSKPGTVFAQDMWGKVS